MERGVQRWAVNIARWDPSEAQLLFCIFLLPPHERPPITKFLNVEDKKRAVVSRMLQYMLVHEVLGIPFKEITIGRTIEGKPYLENSGVKFDFPNFNFNTSHHGDYAVIASEPQCLVGVDVVSLEVPKKENAVEFIKHFSSYFASSEWNNIISAGTSIDILVEFHRYWCLKEAFAKAIGVGLGYSIARLEFHHTNWNDIRVQVDGEDSDDCRFWLSELGKQNWVCVARCHPMRAVQSYKRTLWRVDFDEEEHNLALLLPNREFLLLEVEDLIPKHEKEAYESLRKKCSAAYVRFFLKLVRRMKEMLGEMPKGFRLVKQKFTLRQIKEIHACLIATGKSSNKFQRTKILALYASSPLNTMAFAELVFCQMEKPDTFSINTMIKGYNLHSDPQKALQFYYQMRRRSMASDNFTIAFVLEAMTAALLIRNGKGMHGQMVKFGFETSTVLKTNLIQMYADCGSIDDGSKVFDEMTRKDLISWSTMMAAYARLGRVREALALLEDMKREEITPNEYTMVPLLRACAQTSALTLGEHLHAYIGRSPQIRRDTHLGNVLVYMYAACGALDKAVNVFNEIEQKDVLSWSTMIGGFAVHGHGEEALSLFAQMKFAGVKPNDATLVSVLQACSHAGLVSEGRKHFDLMKSEYGLRPKLEHYGCMVDMLGRAGLLPEAHEFINSMPIPPNAIIWRTLLGACNAHGDTKLAEMVSKTLQQSDSDYVGNHVLMSNIYCKAGRWFDAERTRNMINPITKKKLPGESSIEASSNVNAEIVNPPLHLQIEV